jgi:hypothetical protein
VGWTGKRIRGDTEPAGMVVLGVVRPELLLDVELDIETLIGAGLAQTSSLAIRIASTKSFRRR